jgi:phage portal protein BeeE
LGLITRIADRLLERRALDTMDPLLMLLSRKEVVTRAQAMEIPAFAGCVRFITQTVAGLPVRLYRDTGGRVEPVHGDPRTALLNVDTGDILNGWQFKQSLAADILIEGGGYAYIRRYRNQALSLHYVARQHMSFLPGTDPIFKRCGIMVNGRRYYDFEFISAT